MGVGSPSSLLVGRLAPSPTGAQHLGNARTFLIAWLFLRSQDGHVILRVEDLDTPRTKSWANAQAIEDLQWLGLDWDSLAPLQSSRGPRYSEVLDELKSRELVYPCSCSRSEIEACSSAPHESFLDGVVYSGHCAGRNAAYSQRLDAQGHPYAWRFRFEKGTMSWNDDYLGLQRLDAQTFLGDFVVARNYGPAAYQLAVTVDDHMQGVNHVARGDDLVYSTYRQLAIYKALGWQTPRWMHVPLVVGGDGRRLAKRHGDTRLATWRAQGKRPEEIVGWIAQSIGLSQTYAPLSASELLNLACQDPLWWQRIPKSPWVFDLDVQSQRD
jgi:glutamyl-tRNA synthetase